MSDLRNRVRAEIERGLTNDVKDFSKDPDTPSEKAYHRVKQFRVWFQNIFERWYKDARKVLDSSGLKVPRKCLTHGDRESSKSGPFLGFEYTT